MQNKNNRTDAEEAAANQTGGLINQVKGDLKQMAGDLLGSSSLKQDGAKDRLKGKLQEEYGEVKEKETRLENELKNLDDNRA
jgi:uncharacterized protein YjbJ (UPF0337 family)